ncbi:MAG: thioredoxin domain-containing protein [candidate division NC10 bacterium]|nr:thioredoxin domain-containing protein [candidate division NC10 bacterium]MDE2320696.1 thioredoxin domain-containing protein [candidate division NC10 bacterium]
MRIGRALAAVTIVILAYATAQAAEITGDELKKVLQENPNILIETIKANRKAIFDIINQTGLEEQARMQKEAEEAERRAYEDAFRNPLKPAIDDKTRIRGSKDAKYTLVEYSDFQCPYCARAYPTVEELRKRHGNDLRFIYKHLPLPFHPQAMPAAQWLEAVAIQSPEKAWKFHDILFENQDKLGVDFFKKTAKDLGVDVERCEKDAESQAVKDRIAADIEEAKRFGFNGTPGFLLNGIPVKGAYPIEYFEEIIKKLATTKAD